MKLQLLLALSPFVIAQESCSVILGGEDDDVPHNCYGYDPTMNPYAPELCDGRDNDCDGTIDEGCDTTPVPTPSTPEVTW